MGHIIHLTDGTMGKSHCGSRRKRVCCLVLNWHLVNLLSNRHNQLGIHLWPLWLFCPPQQLSTIRLFSLIKLCREVHFRTIHFFLQTIKLPKVLCFGSLFSLPLFLLGFFSLPLFVLFSCSCFLSGFLGLFFILGFVKVAWLTLLITASMLHRNKRGTPIKICTIGCFCQRPVLERFSYPNFDQLWQYWMPGCSKICRIQLPKDFLILVSINIWPTEIFCLGMKDQEEEEADWINLLWMGWMGK